MQTTSLTPACAALVCVLRMVCMWASLYSGGYSVSLQADTLQADTLAQAPVRYTLTWTRLAAALNEHKQTQVLSLIQSIE